MRKLASIQRVRELRPIEGADAIELASILGWQVVVKKGEYNVGDLLLYCEVDSILPEKPEFEFLRSRNFRIKTIKLKGQVSQGICFPLSILPDDAPKNEGDDLTRYLEVAQHEIQMPAHLSGTPKGKFPAFIPKTDEPRVQNMQAVLDHHVGERGYITEKMDGSSTTYFLNAGEFGVCTRNFEIIEEAENSYWKVARELDIENKLRKLGRNLALQGELVGEGVQSNKLRLKGLTVMFYNAYDIDKQAHLNFDGFVKLMADFGLQTVPIIDTNFTLHNDIAQWVSMGTAKSTFANNVPPKDGWAEGFVVRTVGTIVDGHGHTHRLSFKVLNPEFLLRWGE